MNVFSGNADRDRVDLGGGQSRTVCAWNADQMLVKVDFETGACGADHTHPHSQISYVLEGEFSYHIENDVYTMCAGDSVVVERGKVHGCKCLKKGTLLDIFAPAREDFLK